MLMTCQTWREAWFRLFFKTGTCLYYHMQPGLLPWHTLVPVVVYSDWTMRLPCGCRAAPLLCGNWCLWYCRVAAVPWVTVLATCPALTAFRVKRRSHRSGRGGEASACHVGQGGSSEICDGPTRRIQQDQGNGIWWRFTFSLSCKCLITAVPWSSKFWTNSHVLICMLSNCFSLSCNWCYSFSMLCCWSQ